MATTITNRDLCRFFFAADTDHNYVCIYCGTRRKQIPSNGYANLVSNLKDKHPDYKRDFEVQQSRQAGSLSVHGFVSPEAANMYRWMERVVDRNMPLSEVDDPLTRAMSNLKPICSKALKAYLAATVKEVERKISDEITGPYGLMFDGWTHNFEHYVALFAVFWADGELKQPLLAMAPMEEGDQTAQAHCEYMKKISGIFGQSVSALGFLIGDNCATNRAAAIRLNVPLIGCASHRFNLAVHTFLGQHTETVDAVSTLILALRTINNRAALREYKDLAPLRPNVTRWSSTYAMIARYVRIRDAAKKVEAMFDLIPKAATHRRIEALLADLEIFNSVTVKLQVEDLSLAEVRTLFDSVMQRFPSMKPQLKASANIVHSPVFTAAAVKVINGDRLTGAERNALRKFEKTAVVSGQKRRRDNKEEQQQKEPDFATTILQARNEVSTSLASEAYSELLPNLPPTSNRCERLFSQAKLVLTPQRASLLPVNVETLLFLRTNRSYWDVGTVLMFSSRCEGTACRIFRAPIARASSLSYARSGLSSVRGSEESPLSDPEYAVIDYGDRLRGSS